MFKRVLVAYDNRENSGRALAEAADLAKATGAQLTVLSVVPKLSALYGSSIVMPQHLDDLQKEIEENWRTEQQAAVDTLPQDLAVTSKLRVGHPADEIVHQAEAGHNDLVVVGTRGHGVASLFLGSVSRHVAHSSPVPVLIVGAEAS